MGRIIVVEGPTAVGKSAVAIGIARHFGCPIIGADSRQIYREMTIGTAAVRPCQMGGVQHYMVQDRSIMEPLSAGGYEREVIALIEKLSCDKPQDATVAVIAGGSGLYVEALLHGLDQIPGNPQIREKINQQLATEGLETLAQELQKLDPEYFATIDDLNPRRITRALEAIHTSGQKYSALRLGKTQKRTFQHTKIILEIPRTDLYTRINKRVDIMMEEGLLTEVKTLTQHQQLQALQTVGYREIFEHLNGNATLNFAIDKIKQHTRNYAKRQETWLKKSAPTAPRFAPTDLPQIIAHLEQHALWE